MSERASERASEPTSQRASERASEPASQRASEPASEVCMCIHVYIIIIIIIIIIIEVFTEDHCVVVTSVVPCKLISPLNYNITLDTAF